MSRDLGSALRSLSCAIALATACGSAAGSQGTPLADQVIRDPDNPSFSGRIIGPSETRSVIKDPDNPYWSGSTAIVGATDTSIDPVRGPR